MQHQIWEAFVFWGWYEAGRAVSRVTPSPPPLRPLLEQGIKMHLSHQRALGYLGDHRRRLRTVSASQKVQHHTLQKHGSNISGPSMAVGSPPPPPKKKATPYVGGTLAEDSSTIHRASPKPNVSSAVFRSNACGHHRAAFSRHRASQSNQRRQRREPIESSRTPLG